MSEKQASFEEIEKMLSEADPEMIPAVLGFVTAVVSLHEEARKATNVEAVEDICIRGLIDPVVDAAVLTEDPSRALSTLFDLDSVMITSDFGVRVLESSIPEDEKEKIVSNIDDYEYVLMAKFRSRLNDRAARLAESNYAKDNEVSSWLYDIVKFQQDDGKSKLDNVNRGIISSWKSLKSFIKRQNSVFSGMRGHVKSLNDISIWYSRYMLVPAIENARDGYVKELAIMSSISDDQIAEDCVKLANELGFDASKDDFNVVQIRRSMRQLCKARTGYANPSVFLLSLLPDSEITRIQSKQRI